MNQVKLRLTKLILYIWPWPHKIVCSVESSSRCTLYSTVPVLSINVLLINKAKTYPHLSHWGLFWNSPSPCSWRCFGKQWAEKHTAVHLCTLLMTEAAQGQRAVQGCRGSACHISCTSAVIVQVHLHWSAEPLAFASEHICVLSPCQKGGQPWVFESVLLTAEISVVR